MPNTTINPWIQFYQPKPQANLRLFCFPYAGGKAQIFRTWSEALPDQIEVCPIELPGRGRRWGETPFKQLPLLIEAIANAIAPLLNRPYALFGHSIGALIAFELARFLRQQNSSEPVNLFVSSRRAPQLQNSDTHSHTLPDDALIRKLCWLKGIPQNALDDPELMQLWLPILRADLAIGETYTYVPQRPLSCPIIAFGGRQDPAIRRGGLHQWREQTTGKFAKYLFRGNHFFLHSAQPLLLKQLARVLQEEISTLFINNYRSPVQ